MGLHDIVVGLDESANAGHALRWAAGLADQTAASVRAVSSWQSPTGTWVPVLAAMPSQAHLATRCAERFEKALVEAGLDQGIAHQVEEGSPGPILTRTSTEADLVVLGRTGSGQRTGLQHVTERVLGSTARHCLHHAEAPVAIVPHDQSWASNPVVVVGVDGSPGSIAALRWAVDCLPAGAQISAVWAVPPYKEALLALDRQAMDRILDSAQTELEAAIEMACVPLGNDAARRVAPRVIVEHSRSALLKPSFGANLIVVGQRGSGPVASALLGSVADHVVRQASCPVIVVPAALRAE